MEKLTNNREEYFSQIRKELLDFRTESGWRKEFGFLEVPYFLTYGFAVGFFTKDKEGRLVCRKWNADYDNSRFQLGIYNVDRLAIAEESIEIAKDDNEFFQSIDLEKIDILSHDGIVLDGLHCELQITETGKVLNWNMDDEMNEAMTTLVNRIRKIVYQN